MDDIVDKMHRRVPYYGPHYKQLNKRFPRNPNYYYVNRHPKIKPTMSLVEENYLHPNANSSTVGSSVSLPPQEGSLLRKASANRFQRFDSGVGDLENNGSEFPMQTPRSCSPKTFQYDYAEYPTHQYEELPNKSRTFTREDFHSNHLSNVSSDIPYEGDSPAHSHPHAHEIEMTRKRFNPLYEAVTKAIPDKTSPPQRTVDATYKQLKCLQTWFIIFVVFVFVCLFTILFITLFYNPSDAALVKKFRNLESRYESLESKYQSLVSFWVTSGTNDSSIVLSGLSHRMNSLENETINLNHTLNLMNSLESSLGASLQNVSKFALNVSNELHKTQSVLEEKMLNISKLPGPMGPPGSVDLTKCQFRNVTDFSSDEVTSTIWIPSDPIFKDYIAIGGSCSTRGGRSTQLVKKNHQFRCLCYGHERQKYPIKVCSIHLWLCPQTNY